MSRLQTLIDEARELMAEEPDEAAPRTVKRRGAGSSAKRATKVCPPGTHKVGGKCVRVSASRLKKLARMKAKWRKSGAGKRSAKRSAKLRKRFK